MRIEYNGDGADVLFVIEDVEFLCIRASHSAEFYAFSREKGKVNVSTCLPLCLRHLFFFSINNLALK